MTSLPKKRRLGPKLSRVWDREASKKIGTPYLLLQPLKLATSNFVHKLDLGLSYQKTTFRTKIGGGLGQGSIQKNWDPLFISATVEASDSILHDISSGLSRKKFGLGRMICEGNPKRQFCCNNSEM